MMEMTKFDELAEAVLRPGGLILTRWLAEASEFRQGMQVVDLGCGTGITVEYLRDHYALQASGVDLSKERLELGQKRLPELPLFLASAESLPFADGSLDGVMAECSLSVMENIEKVLAEANRVLVMGGRLAISDLYSREDPGAGAMTFVNWNSLLTRHGFNVLCWKDQVKYLKNFVAGFIMKHGSAEELWQCLRQRRQGAFKEREASHHISYFSLVAVKEAHRILARKG
ncbi:MAG: class I SAM-dependent methyltransferase [Pelosinus sp.]|nr:class I SAM-dependent methyltransferase [Pelosinus sp.]